MNEGWDSYFNAAPKESKTASKVLFTFINSVFSEVVLLISILETKNTALESKEV